MPSLYLRVTAFSHAGELDALMIKHGAVLFRGFALDTPHHFADAVAASGVACLPYIGGAAGV